VKIEKVEARTVIVPLGRPTRISRRALPNRHYTFTRVHGEGGLVGIGFCLGGATVTTAVRQLIAPKVIGSSVHENERLWDELYYDTILQGRRGAAIRALSTFDIALWDLKAKSLELPLAKLLGVYQDPVPSYASGGYYYDDKDPELEVQEESAGWAEAGFTAMKLKVGGAPLEVDVARLAAFRRTVGDAPKLMLDANNAWRDWRTALTAVRRFEEFGIEWIEEPLSPDDVEGHKRLADKLDVAVATGEIEATRWGFAHLLQERAVDVIQADAAVCGGITEWRRIADTAASFDVSLAPHWFADLHVHCVASAPNGRWIEVFPDTRILNVMELFSSSLHPEAGYTPVPEEPGLGIELDHAAMDSFAADAWG
jgi:L-alanine-DL-glutamate epimerase-like enolase superfamily enzyme